MVTPSDNVLEAEQPKTVRMLSKASRASGIKYHGKVTLYGTVTSGKESEAFSGPTFRNKVTIDLGTKEGSSWTNVSYTIPQVSDYFTLKDGWELKDISVSGNSGGGGYTPGGSFLLGMSGGSIIYYFQRVQKTFYLNYNANGGSGAPGRQFHTDRVASYKFIISDRQPTRTGHKFLGWSTDPEATS